MKWNASLAAALSLTLAGCGGARGYSDYGVESAPPLASPGARSWSSARRAAPTLVVRKPEVDAPIEPEAADPRIEAVGAPYAAPDGVSEAPVPEVDPTPAADPALAEPTAQDMPPQVSTDGIPNPSGSSQAAPGEGRYDETGYAGVRPVSGSDTADAVVAVHRSLAPNTVVEFTSIDTGRTILVLITGAMEPGGNRLIDLSAAAAQQLGHDQGSRIPVRVRKVNATPPDIALLRAGRPAEPRPDTPPVLLNALRKRLSPTPAIEDEAPPMARAPAVRPAPRSAVAPAREARPAPGKGYYVQVAALSNAKNAQSLAKALGGSVRQGGGFHRVQLGPFATKAAADRARAGAARAGHGDARVIAVN